MKLKPSHQDTSVCYLFYLCAFELIQVATGRWVEQVGAHSWMHWMALEYKTRRNAASADLLSSTLPERK
jgi:hypothetical protein